MVKYSKAITRSFGRVTKQDCTWLQKYISDDCGINLMLIKYHYWIDRFMRNHENCKMQGNKVRFWFSRSIICQSSGTFTSTDIDTQHMRTKVSLYHRNATVVSEDFFFKYINTNRVYRSLTSRRQRLRRFLCKYLHSSLRVWFLKFCRIFFILINWTLDWKLSYSLFANKF